ncbi:hypothetical protein GCM10009835_48390 [Planosporangium flavigriseum]|uniref:Uncharacterized protein n=1 Tax=Planosporangium flavigriseum TaxID=373681 RepID=A0A8J3PNL2_9ACTN|nr:hypothetical protein Pfl04_38580 [Planosporangium flavigriseum]
MPGVATVISRADKTETVRGRSRSRRGSVGRADGGTVTVTVTVTGTGTGTGTNDIGRKHVDVLPADDR